ncbi:MAG: hypothetical protein ACPG7F_00385 [Aggregatilineales bacterium]
MKLEDAKQLTRHVGRKGTDGQIEQLPELDVMGAPVHPRQPGTDIQIKDTRLFLRLLPGSAFDRERIIAMKRDAPEAIRMVEEAAKPKRAARKSVSADSKQDGS